MIICCNENWYILWIHNLWSTFTSSISSESLKLLSNTSRTVLIIISVMLRWRMAERLSTKDFWLKWWGRQEEESARPLSEAEAPLIPRLQCEGLWRDNQRWWGRHRMIPSFSASFFKYCPVTSSWKSQIKFVAPNTKVHFETSMQEIHDETSSERGVTSLKRELPPHL